MAPVISLPLGSSRSIRIPSAIVDGYLRHRTFFVRIALTGLILSLSFQRSPGGKNSKSSSSKDSTETPATDDKDNINVKTKNPTSQGKTPRVNNASSRASVNSKFFKKLVVLLKIIIPSYTSREFVLLILQSCFLVARSYISLFIASLDGKLVSALVSRKKKRFLKFLVIWMLVAVPATINNAILNYLQSRLYLLFRGNLTATINERYLTGSEMHHSQQNNGGQGRRMSSSVARAHQKHNHHHSIHHLNNEKPFYSLLNLDDRVKNPDQVVTVDVDQFCKTISNLHSNLLKPFLDMFIYSWKLSSNVGGESMVLLGLLIQLSAKFMRMVSPPFGRFITNIASLEGEFRYQHSRLIENSEEIALYSGQEVEKTNLDRSYFKLIKFMNNVFKRRFQYNFFEDFIMKYTWGALGLLVCSTPAFFSSQGAEFHEISGNFVTNRRLLMSASDAFSRIISSFKDISQLAGYTSRVSLFLDVLDDINQGKFVKYNSLENVNNKTLGKVRYGNDILFENVPIISPIGEVLIKDLSFHVKFGQNLLIVGPNGSGKSSLFRIIGELWPVYYPGSVTIPKASDIFYIPQRPYLSKGTLREQLIYPQTEEEFRSSGYNDLDLLAILKILRIDDLLYTAPEGFDTVKEWKEEISMGSQQLVAMARLYYHKPRFAILDECTSSVSLEMENIMYTHAKKLKISLLTVSHRVSLWQYHDLILQFDGKGGYIFGPLDPEKRLKLEQEKLKLDLFLRSVPELRSRLEDLKIVENFHALNSEISLHDFDMNMVD